MLDKYSVAKDLMHSFPGGFVNGRGEFIAHREANQSFILENCVNELEVKCKVLEWFSRGAYKTEPFYRKASNKRFHQFMLNGINAYLATNFSEDDMEIIYTRLGNGINRTLGRKFVESGYNMELLKGE